MQKERAYISRDCHTIQTKYVGVVHNPCTLMVGMHAVENVRWKVTVGCVPIIMLFSCCL